MYRLRRWRKNVLQIYYQGGKIMNRKKRGLALLLCICMLFTLMPMAAFADNDAATTYSKHSETNGVVMDKTITPLGNDDYKVTLEQYVSGTVTSAAKPLDIVLVLDVSGSMDDTFSTGTVKYTAVYPFNGRFYTWNSLYVKDGDSYIKVAWCDECNAYSTCTRTLSWGGFVHTAGTKYAPMTSEDDTSPDHVQFYVSSDPTKLDSLQKSVNSFIDSIANQAKDQNVEHKISIVSFADNATTVAPLTSVKDGSGEGTNTEKLKSAVSSLTAYGATEVGKGLEQAKTNFGTASSNTERQRVVIMFTDGVPGGYNNGKFSDEIANAAISTANTLKKSVANGGYGALVYTIGIFKNAAIGDSLPKNEVDTSGFIITTTDYTKKCNRYMHLVSSNYPNATNMDTPGTPGAVTNGYYKIASSADELNTAFNDIAGSVTTPAVQLGANAVLTDNVAANFKAPANTTDVKVYTAAAKPDGTFDTRVETPATVTITDNAVSVTGFDYSANAVTTTAKSDGTYGSKLIVEFTITVDRDKTYGGTQPTNAGANIKLDGVEMASVENPTVPVTIINEYSANVSKSKDYDGKGFNIWNEISTNSTLIPTGVKNGHVNIVYTVKDNDNNVVGTYTVNAGKSTGEWVLATGQTGLTPADVGTYNYTITCTVSDAINPGATAVTKDGTAKFEIKQTDFNVKYQYADVSPENAPALTDYNHTAKMGSSVTVKDAPALEGYTFSGWECKTAGVTVDETSNTFTMPAKDVVFEGSWTRNTHGVTYTYTGTVPTGAPALPNSGTASEVLYGTKVSVAENPTLDGYTFSGWDTTSNGVTVGTDGKFTMPDNDVKFTGYWTARGDIGYKVEYYWIGNETTPIADAENGTGTFNETVTASGNQLKTIPGYTLIDSGTNYNPSVKLTDATGDNVIKLYYYKNVTVTITGEQKEFVYNGEEHSAGYTLTSSDTNYNVNKVKFSGTKSTLTGKDVCDESLGLNVSQFSNTDSNYKVTFVLEKDATLKITPIQLKLESQTASKNYDGTALTAPDVTVTGAPVAGEITNIRATGSITDPGSTTNTIVFDKGANYKAANYSIEKSEGTLTVVATYTVTYKYVDKDNKEITTLNGTALTAPTEGRHAANDKFNVANYTAVSGYDFSGWTYDDTTYSTGDEFTMPGNAVEFVGKFTPQEGLSYTVNYYWNGTTTKVAESKPVDKQTFGETYTESPITIEGYTAVSNASVTKTITTGENVINFYYYKNVELTAFSNGDTAYYDGTLQSVTGFAVNVIPDKSDANLANADKLFPQISAGVSGTDAGKYTSKFSLLDPIDGWTAVKPEGLKGQTDINGQYYVVSAKEGKLTIAKRPVTLTSETASKPYDGTPLTRPDVIIGGEGFVTGEVVADSIKATGTIMYPASVQGTGSVENTIVYETTGKFNADNYKITEYPGTLSITDRGTPLDPNNPNEIVPKYNVSIVALDDSKVYNGQLQFADKGFTVNGTTNADNSGDTVFTAENSLNYTISNVKASGEGKDVNDDGYPIKIVAVGEGYKIVDKYGVDVTNQFEIRTTPGKLTITPIDGVKVTIKGHTDTVQYDGKEHIVTGYDISADNALFDISEVDYRGTAEAKGTNVDTYPMNLKDEGFSYTGNNFENVKFVVTDGWLKIESKPVIDTGIYTKITVKITGNSASEVYDGTEKSVEGYTVEISDPRYTEKDFKFTGTAEANGTYVGEYPMGLEADQFVNINRRFKNVEFIIVEDGVLTITARPITITAGSAEGWVTDCPITCDEWTSTPPAPGDTVVSVKVTGSQNGPGSSPNVPSDAVIENAAGKDVTDNYDITYVNGVLTAIDLLEKEDHFNYVIGYPDGSVQPNGNITRAEVATIFYRLLTDDARAKYATTSNSFSDIKTGEWYTKAISTLENAGIIGGYPDGTFKPNASITRAEMATIIAKFASLDANGKTFTDIKGHWAQSYIELAAGNGWINGYEDGTFRPDKNITRAETFAMINRVLERQVASADDLLPTSQMNMWTDNLNAKAWYYVDVQEATNYHKCDRVNESAYETWTEKVPDIDWAKHQI